MKLQSKLNQQHESLTNQFLGTIQTLRSQMEESKKAMQKRLDQLELHIEHQSKSVSVYDL
jgi:hypothetical protein